MSSNNQSDHDPGSRKVYTLKGVEYPFRWCPPGIFMMGTPDDEAGRDEDEALHEVELTRGFWILETPITQKMYESVMGENPSGFHGEDLPVEQVNLPMILDFCAELNQLLNDPDKEISLPTEAQWEYACRAGTSAPFENFDSIDPVGWSLENADQKTHPVAQKQPNPWGIYDLHGNVFEWCLDWYADYTGERLDPAGPPKELTFRCMRGGAWNAPGRICRASSRLGCSPECVHNYNGFRIVLNPKY
ncbi:MAG: formylglycine-generating enzyme family protein [Planctomycetia bacterium]|nr:formylglycine-generating enzyme family protein [Planctomycetia bacterium]